MSDSASIQADPVQSAQIGTIPTAPTPSQFIGQSPAAAPGGLQDTTLDEPVLDTVLRDVKMVWKKLKKVVIPSEDTKDELRNWCCSPLPSNDAFQHTPHISIHMVE